ncbi:SDR family oxidoreductase [Anaerobacillus isosaccharinicus]|uniref:SDR family oxidoreductase n=1 Tax=Anaerobacillus isosaccharinicus TaxID=1532552 RepID=A0A1S2LL70_9BACI|nr:SDR family oxidoreductase [Anaerobacillus isosaccharinicus]MBA5586170.1 SDR family oxidoreductase [Anaerobacillus isosaccharinicus]QOY35565.1 SDR family oxidoreductase [Anaerobacillus isosaccharinicus]
MLENQVVIVTGGTRGIGEGIVKLLLNEKAKTIVLAKNKNSIAKLQEAFVGLGDLDTYQCDVTSSEQVSNVIDTIFKKYGRIDTLVNNAGVGVWKPVEEMTEEDWDSQINTNLKGAFLCSQAVYKKMMVNNGGQIVNIASDLAYNTTEKASAYCASKWGLLGLSHTMNKEGKKYGIRVTSVSPGLVQTDFGGVLASKKATGLTVETVADQVLAVIKAGKDAGAIDVIIRP